MSREPKKTEYLGLPTTINVICDFLFRFTWEWLDFLAAFGVVCARRQPLATSIESEGKTNDFGGVQKLVQKNGIPTRQLNKDVKDFRNGITAKLLMK